MKTTLTYATETCGRCGGSGHYSYNQITGTTCFGCKGRKTRLTKAGAKAQAAVLAFITAHFSVKVRDLQPGDRIRVDGYARTIVSATFSGAHGSSNGVPYEQWSLDFNKPVPSAFGRYSSLGTSGDATMVKAVSGADWDAVVAFARTLKSGVTVTVTA
jgi:hypothetical protein